MAPQPHRMTGVALITGGGSGIGRAAAHTFVREGCTRLALSDLDEAGLFTVKKELLELDDKVETCLIKADVSIEQEVEEMVQKAVTKFGAIHYAVNCAGITSKPRVRTHELSTDSWDAVQSVNLRGVWLCERAELRQMIRQEASLQMRTGAPPQRGSIVNVSSLFGILSHPTVGAYSATKAGVMGLTRTDALAYARDGIRVNSILPGFVKTPMVEESIRRGANYEAIIDTIPIGRWGKPEEIAEGIVFFCSEKASLITGTELVIDGGKQYAA